MRKLLRSIARHRMETEGMTKINKPWKFRRLWRKYARRA